MVAIEGNSLGNVNTIYMKPALSEREEEVRTLVNDRGQSYETVAEWLEISPKTVHSHMTRIRSKYRANGEPLPDKRRRFNLN